MTLSRQLPAGLLLLLLVACIGSACGPGRTPNAETPIMEVKKDEPGMIVKVGEAGYQIASQSGLRLHPDTLPDSFKVDGLRVIFSGEVHERPQQVKMMGRPFVLTDIRRDTTR